MTTKKGYNEQEREHFRKIIVEKLENAKENLARLEASWETTNRNIAQDKIKSFDDAFMVEEQENIHSLILREKKYIQHLQAALKRVATPEYGVCVKTGQLIPKERLELVPHATLSVAAKMSRPGHARPS